MEIQPQSQVFDVDRENFEEAVLRGSEERVIVVDFWAPWCGPCRTLGPILEEVVRSLGPGVALAKVNVDENQDLAMAFRVQSIPAVKIVKDGRLAQEFTGALPRAQIEAILRPLVDEVPEEEGEEGPLERAAERAEMGDLEGAARLYEAHLKEKPADPPALLGLARVRLLQGDFDAVQELVNLIDEAAPEYRQGRALLTQLQFGAVCQAAGGRRSCAEKLLGDPADLEARYGLACCAAVEGDYETALKEWLTIVEKKRDFREGAAREAMVSVFHLLGRDNALVADFQRRLYQALY